MAIYWVAVREVASKKAQEEGEACGKIVLPPTAVEAADEKEAILRAVGLYPTAADSSKKVEVLVRPF